MFKHQANQFARLKCTYSHLYTLSNDFYLQTFFLSTSLRQGIPTSTSSSSFSSSSYSSLSLPLSFFSHFLLLSISFPLAFSFCVSSYALPLPIRCQSRCHCINYTFNLFFLSVSQILYQAYKTSSLHFL